MKAARNVGADVVGLGPELFCSAQTFEGRKALARTFEESPLSKLASCAGLNRGVAETKTCTWSVATSSRRSLWRRQHSRIAFLRAPRLEW
jgi:hypothetical protein